MKSQRGFALLLAGAALLAATPRPGAAQGAEGSDGHASVLQREHPELYTLLLRLERAHGIVFGQLFTEGEAVRASGSDVPTGNFELELVERLTGLVESEGTLEDVAAESAAGYAMLGTRGAAVIARANAFHREVLGILVDRSVRNQKAELAEAVQRYLSRPDIAFPAAPKNMDVLYDHTYARGFRTAYADLGGFVWAGHWLQLAATEPITDIPGPAERAAGLDTVMTRYYAKLSYGEPPEFFPSELPLAPPIAPGMTIPYPEVAMIWDNLNMMQEVLADVLISPTVPDVRAAIDEVIDQFLDPAYRMTTRDEWELMALRHGIFNQGGFPLAVMTESERNSGGHFEHMRNGGQIIIPGMPD